MKVIDHINNAKSPMFSIELLPPLKGKGIDSLFNTVDNLLEFNPAFINVTSHRSEFIFEEREDGRFDKVWIQKRPGTVGICASIKTKYNIDPVPHIVCGGFNKKETEAALLELTYLGIDNVLALRGDALKTDGYYKPEPEGNNNAVDLIKQIKGANSGDFYLPSNKGANATNFCIGTACYPEKHYEAPNIETDIAFLKQKVNAGADYLITQMFYDNQKYFDFVKLCRNNGINVPIIPGLNPIITKNQMTVLPKIFSIDLPYELSVQLNACKDNDEAKEVGVAWGIKQAKELLAFGVPGLHFFTMSLADSVNKIAKEIF